MGQTHFMQCIVSQEHVLMDPGTRASFAGFGTRADNLLESAVCPNFIIRVLQSFSERSRYLEFACKKHRAWIRTPPQNGVIFIEPGKNTEAIGLQKSPSRKIA